MKHVVSAGPVRFRLDVSEAKVTIVRAKPPAPPWYRFATEIARLVDWEHLIEVAQNIWQAMFRRAPGQVQGRRVLTADGGERSRRGEGSPSTGCTRAHNTSVDYKAEVLYCSPFARRGESPNG